MTTIRHGGFELDLMPETGGSVRAFRLGDIDILRPHPDGVTGDPLLSGGFPLFPFSGRIDQARFDWQDETVQLNRNFPPERHAIHGNAWQAPWQVETLTATRCVLMFESESSDWPWHYRASQTFTLGPEGLSLELELTNLGETAMPAGLGWHPYFPREDAEIEALVEAVWRKRADLIPDQLVALNDATDLNRRRPVDGLTLDDIFSAPERRSVLTWARRQLRVEMTATNLLSTLVVFVPPGEEFFCVEPVSHVPNAVNMSEHRDDTGLVTLARHQDCRATVTLHPFRTT